MHDTLQPIDWLVESSLDNTSRTSWAFYDCDYDCDCNVSISPKLKVTENFIFFYKIDSAIKYDCDSKFDLDCDN